MPTDRPTVSESERLDEIEALLHGAMPEPHATRWRYEVIMELIGQQRAAAARIRELEAENEKLRKRGRDGFRRVVRALRQAHTESEDRNG